ncbi:geminin-like [Leptidea sinapis]|uniref:geminin-like n=1 Tax=Leptidea sinapis TaxID=189913 RepID=UPI0021280D8A|nr:geminin-like [Leptidea sinapis]XP_050666744.1 geminin-like [Leptidea sinapis]
MPRTTRKSLKTLQQSSSDTENLVGRPQKSLKHQLSQESQGEVEVKKKNNKEAQVNSEKKINKEVQVNFGDITTLNDLTDSKPASDNYWQKLAEKRQKSLHESFEENQRLLKIIEDLTEEKDKLKQMLEEANSLIEVIKEEIAISPEDDTGIDLNYVSTADESQLSENQENGDGEL